jgi:subtilisin family serine protease
VSQIRLFIRAAFGRCALLGVLLASATACTPEVAPEQKIDPPLQEAIQAGQPARVIVLGRTQLFAPIGGLEQFAKAHPNDDRRTLRKEVVATLKANAAKEQAVILKALQKDSAERALWILNAMSMELTPAEIKTASELDEVLFIYAGGEPLTPWAPATSPILVQPELTPPFSPEGKQVAWNVRHLNAPPVWTEFNNSGSGAIIAVLDNGANYAHQDLRANVWRNGGEIPNNDIDDDGNGWVDDVYGYNFGAMTADVRDTSSDRQHGTMTSGIALGDGTGGTITGVAPRAKLMLLKMTGGNVDAAGNRPIAAALAYQYALENGADILSMSFSLPELGNLRGYWRMMSDHAVAAGLVLVGGSGNFRQTQPIPVQIQTPKDVPSVIAVGGIDTLNELVTFSSMGPAEWSTVSLYGDYPLPAGIIKPELVAYPGEGYPVLSVTDSGYIDTNVIRRRGNSFSGPQVAGIAALMFTERPEMSVWRLREILEQTAHDLGDPGQDNMFGFGRVDAYKAVEMVRQSTVRR